MKIAHIFSHFNIGGAQTMLSDIMNVQVRTNEVSLFVLLDDVNNALIDRLDKRIKVHLLKRIKGSMNYWPYVQLNYAINFGGYDVVHLHEKTIWKQLFIAPWVRLFQTVHNTGIFCPNFHRCRIVFSISNSVQEGLIENGITNTVVAPNGINPDIILNKTKFRKEISSSFRMVQVSRLIVEHKGQDLIIEALHLIKEKGELPPNIVIDFIGEGRDESLLKCLVQQYGLEKNVRFLGVKDRDYVYENLKEYDLFVQPSRYEGFGLTVVEAMAASLPVLVSNNEGPFEIIEYGKYGYYFENRSASSLADALKSIYNNYNEVELKAKAARQYVIDKYSVGHTANIYLDNYKL